MAPQKMINTPGVLNNLTFRGIGHRKIFNDDHDRDQFIKRLCRLAIICGAAVLPSDLDSLAGFKFPAN
jgi:hypothetical protein